MADNNTHQEDQKRLENLRSKIDEVDERLVALLKERLDLVKEAAAVKKDLKEGSYSQGREDFLLQHRSHLAAKYSLPEGLMEDLLKRLLRESYKQSGEGQYACTAQNPGPVVLVGGRGGMGRIFEKFFKASGYEVRIFGQEDWANPQPLLQGAMVVMVCVPIDATLEVIEKLGPLLNPKTILCDITSVKSAPLEAMLKAHPGPVLGLHPMFGPDIPSMVKQVIVDAGGRDHERCEFLIEQFKLWGARICRCAAQEHDKAMGIIQAMRHFTTYCYGLFLQKAGADLNAILDLSSPIYHLELLMVGRLFAQDPHLYCDIIMSSEYNLELIEGYLKTIEDEFGVVKEQDKDEFVKRFLAVRQYFGEYAQTFLKESGQLLAKIKD